MISFLNIVSDRLSVDSNGPRFFYRQLDMKVASLIIASSRLSADSNGPTFFYRHD